MSTQPNVTLTAKDWAEIYYALASKLNCTTVIGCDSESRQWRGHLRSIMQKIGPDGRTAAQSGTVQS